LLPLGYAQIIFIYDEDDRIIETHFNDVSGNPICNNEKYAIKKTVYDARGNVTEEIFVNTTGELVSTIYNYARVKKS
jgi:hypothetical protein